MSFPKALVTEPRNETLTRRMKQKKTIRWSERIRCGTSWISRC